MRGVCPESRMIAGPALMPWSVHVHGIVRETP